MAEDRLELMINEEELTQRLTPLEGIKPLLEELPKPICDKFLCLAGSLLLEIAVTSTRSAFDTCHFVANAGAIRHFELVSTALATLQRQLHR